MMTMTRTEESTAVATAVALTLLLAFELGERVWKLGFTTGLAQRPRIRQIPARATDRVLEEMARAKVRFRSPADAPVVSCFEAGREGFACTDGWWITQ
jgi:transposase